MVERLTFIDCASCGKRIRTNALRCHHCHQDNLPDSANRSTVMRKSEPGSEYGGSSSHAAIEDEHRGADADGFDYDEYLAEEFPEHATQRRQPRVKLWVWITAWVLIAATLTPYLYNLMFLRR